MRVVEVAGLDHGRRVAVRVEDARVSLAWDLAVDPHRAHEDQARESARAHRRDDALGLALHVAREVGVDHVLPAHRRLESGAVEHVALDDRDALRVGVGEPTRAPQKEVEPRVGVAQKHARRGTSTAASTVRMRDSEGGVRPCERNHRTISPEPMLAGSNSQNSAKYAERISARSRVRLDQSKAGARARPWRRRLYRTRAPGLRCSDVTVSAPGIEGPRERSTDP